MTTALRTVMLLVHDPRAHAAIAVLAALGAALLLGSGEVAAIPKYPN